MISNGELFMRMVIMSMLMMVMAMMMTMMSFLVNNVSFVWESRHVFVCLSAALAHLCQVSALLLLIERLECMLTCIIRRGSTAVHFAVERNQLAFIQALVKIQADVNIRDGCACVAAFLWLQS